MLHIIKKTCIFFLKQSFISKPPRFIAYLYLFVYITCFFFCTLVIDLSIKKPYGIGKKILGSIKSEDIFTQNCLPSSISKDHLTGALSRNGNRLTQLFKVQLPSQPFHPHSI